MAEVCDVARRGNTLGMDVIMIVSTLTGMVAAIGFAIRLDVRR
jgi:hypothetical protein